MTQKFRITLRCKTCGNKWSRVVVDPDKADPPCPQCRRRYETRGMDYDSNRAPANVGNNNHIKAIDQTAEIVMRDHGMTDLRSDVREGETSAPKLAPHLQKAADSFFQRPASRNKLIPNAALMARRAMAGSYSPGASRSPDPVAVAQAPRSPVPVQIMYSDAQGKKRK